MSFLTPEDQARELISYLSVFVPGRPGGQMGASKGRDWHELASAGAVTGAAFAAGRAGAIVESEAPEERRGV